MEKRLATQIQERRSRALDILLRAVLYNCSQPVFIADDDRRFSDASSGACILAGRSRDQIIGRKLDELLDPSARPKLESLWAAFLTEGSQQGSFTLGQLGGAARPVSYIFRRNVLPGRHLAAFQYDHPNDDSGKKPMLTDAPALKEVRDFALCLLDVSGVLTAWYEGAERIYGYSSEEALGRPLTFLDSDDHTRKGELHPDLARAHDSGRCGSQGWRKRKDGSRLWAHMLTSAVQDDEGNLLGFVNVSRDFTAYRETEQKRLQRVAVRESRSAGAAPVVGIVSGEFDRITDASDAFLAIVGYNLDDFTVGRPYWPEITPREYRGATEQAHEEALLYGACSPYETEYIRKDGSRVRVLVTVAVLGLSPFRWMTLVQDLTQPKKPSLEPPPVRTSNFTEIVGDSAAMRRVLGQTEIVAPTEATVLILGETGTGKELVARAIHKRSLRSGPFVTLNCAAIPTGLLESELFGYEKGAFTGALSRKIGRFEMANGGTLFLDEVGDIPLELQPKLLRALQEKEFERLGGTRTIPIDVRLLAATNRDLARMMGDKLFRSDLYYRLKVFPVIVPALRDHPEDIPALALHFMEKYARQTKRDIQAIPPATMRALMQWSWPGNVRELENFIERSVILSQGPTLQAPLAELQSDGTQPASSSTLDQVEREHIIRVLGESGGVVSRAAKRLGMPRTTLNGMMRKLGITRKDF